MSRNLSLGQRLLFVVGLAACAWLMIAFLAGSNASAQGGGQSEPVIPKMELEKKQGHEQRMEAYGFDLLGDSIDPHTGMIAFKTTDISIPGNFKLPVALGRKRSGGRTYLRGVSAEFGDWEADIPKIVVQLYENSPFDSQFCSRSFEQTMPTINYWGTPYHRNKYSGGVKMHIPGQGAKQLLEAPKGLNWPSGTSHVTTDYWRLECLPITGGQGFLAYAPDGTIYRFDRKFEREGHPLGARTVTMGPSSSNIFPRKVHTLAASRVTDVHGNTVDYTYDALGNVTRISASDGRRIDIAYSGGRVSSATANGRTWRYAYGVQGWDDILASGQVRNDALISVELPDGQSWAYSIAGMDAEPGVQKLCWQRPQTLTVAHPYGAEGVFVLNQIRQRTSYRQQDEVVRAGCPNEYFEPAENPGPKTYELRRASMMAVTEKRVTGPNLNEMVWKYKFEHDGGAAGSSGSDPTNWTKLTDPEGNETTYYHFWNEGDWTAGQTFGGELDRTELRNNVGQLVETTQHAYAQEESIGHMATGYLSFTASRPTHRSSTTIERDGDRFTTTHNIATRQTSSAYSFGKPTRTIRTANTGETRTTTTDYVHKRHRWVVGLPSLIKVEGRTYAALEYDDHGRPVSYRKYGEPWRTYAYHQGTGVGGALRTVTDAEGASAVFTSWHRGVPGRVKRWDGSTILQSVDDNGWVKSATDPRGNVTRFSHNSVGWTTAIDWPVGADVGIYYGNIGATNFYAHIRQGRRKDVVRYDALHRPIVVSSSAQGAAAGYQRIVYDRLGRETFKSALGPSANAWLGEQSTYDALGRVVRVRNTATGGTTTTAYASGGTKTVTNPIGDVTVTTSAHFGDPGADPEIRTVRQPEGLTTRMAYDAHGNMTLLRQHGLSGDVTRLFWYDGHNRMCRQRAPEFGDEVLVYDALSRLSAKAKGLPSGSGCGSPPAADRISYSYDPMGRMTRTDFPTGTPDIVNQYDAAGLLKQAAREGGVTWEYEYDALGRPIKETLVRPGDDLELAYTYAPEGGIATMATPRLPKVHFDPDGLGRPTAIRMGPQTLVSGASYDFHGGLTSLQMGNGAQLDQTYNNRNLLASAALRGAESGLIDGKLYQYYPTMPRLSAITDQVDASKNRAFSYDGLGRLIAASGEWGMGRYSYDVLGNILTRDLDAIMDTTSTYDARNRLASVYRARRDRPGETIAFEHDARGNVTKRGDWTFAYGHDNQIRTATGPAPDKVDLDGLAEVGWLLTDEPLLVGEKMTSVGGRYVATLTDWGQLQIFDEGRLVWSTPRGDVRSIDHALYAQSDGNLVVYRFGPGPTHVVWASYSFTTGPATIAMQTDGNFVQYMNGVQPIFARTWRPDQERDVSAPPEVRYLNDGGAQASLQFEYDAHGHRVSKVSGGKAELYAYSHATGRLSVMEEGPEQTAVLNLGPVRVQAATAGPGASAEIEYIVADNQRSAQTRLDQNGSVIGKEAWTPFGLPLRLADGPGEPGYTGHVYDGGMGLTYMRARYYDPLTARFMQQDPIDYADQLNLYAYVHNDPVNATDPTGEFANFIAKFVVDVALEVAVQVASGDDINVGSAVAGAAAGVVDPTRTARKAAKLARVVSRSRKSCCFAAGTLVTTDEGLKPIETIEVGDRVLARDETTGETAYKPVTELVQRHDRIIWQVEVAATDGLIHTFEATDDHPWWVSGRGWIRTHGLTSGMSISTANGLGVRVVSVIKTDATRLTYNLEVNDFHTYFVGEQGVWVHNGPCNSPKVKSSRKERLKPVSDAQGPHSTFRRDGDGNITRHETWDPNPQNPSGFDRRQSTDMTGPSHYNKVTNENVATPHTQSKSIPGGVRAATPEEIPKPRKP